MARTASPPGKREPEALEQLEAEMAAETVAEELELSEEERALMAVGELGSSSESDAGELELDLSDEDLMAEIEGLDLDEDLLAEGGDDAAPKE